MRIGMIISTGFPPDIRLEKEIDSIRERHDVALLCRGRPGQPATDTWHDVPIYRALQGWRGAAGVASLMFRQQSGLWSGAIEAYIRQFKPDILHVHDLPLLGTVLAIARRHSLPVVSDLHENYPAMLAQSKDIPLSQTGSLGQLASRLIVSIPKWHRYEQRVVPAADNVIVVIEEARDRLLEMGVNADRLHVVGNYASPPANEAAKSDQQEARHRGTFRVVYAGGFDATRDLETVVRAAQLLPPETYPDLAIHLIGGTGRALEQMHNLTESLNVSDRVHIEAWMPLDDVEAIMSEARIGLVPHVKSAHTDATIPHKIFQYMRAGLPVVASDCAPLERVVSTSNAGLVYPTGDHAALADRIAQIYSDDARAAAMGRAGAAAVDSTYNWQAAADVLLGIYDRVSSSESSRRE